MRWSRPRGISALVAVVINSDIYCPPTLCQALDQPLCIGNGCFAQRPYKESLFSPFLNHSLFIMHFSCLLIVLICKLFTIHLSKHLSEYRYNYTYAKSQELQ